MAGYILLGTLAAIGLLSVLWVCYGALLSGCREGVFVCMGQPCGETVARYCWLRDMGLINGPMLIVDDAWEEEYSLLTGNGIEVCRREDLFARLERERDGNDAAGNGDPPGRGQRRGISEL